MEEKKKRRKLTEAEKKQREEEKKKKALEKQKQFQELLDKYPMNVSKEDYGDYVEYDMLLQFNIKPYERTRKGMYGQMYDPLSKYKTELKKVFKHHMGISSNKEYFLGECHIDIQTFVKLPKSTTKKTQLYALKGLYKPLQKPDNDNLEKTLFDIFSGWLYLDDTQICKNTHEKFFHVQEGTIIKIKIYKENIDIQGRINKEEEIELCNLLKLKKIY